MTKIRIIVVLVVGICLILLFLAFELLAPGDTIQQTGPDNATIVFSADHGMVFTSGMCVTVRWQVDHIQKVFINSQPTVGQGFQQVCVDESTMPVLRVKFQDNTATDYTLQIGFLVEQPSTWLLFGAAILLALLSLFVALSRPAAVPAQTTGAGKRTSRILLFFAGIGILFTGVSVMALILEVGLRFYFGHFGSQAEQDAYLNSQAEVAAHVSYSIPLPFVEYGLSPDFPGQNALGYRGDPIEVPKPAGVYRIVVLGDSTTYGTLVAYDQTYPAQLQQVLRSQYGDKNVEVVNAGVPLYTSWNILTALEFRVTELQPDLVIIYEGGNDLNAREVPTDCYSGASPFLGLDPRRYLRAAPPDLSASALYRFLAINLGWMQNPTQDADVNVLSRISCSPVDDSQFQQYLAANPPTYFTRNVREMIAVAQANAFKLMFMTMAFNPTSTTVQDWQRAALAQNNAITVQLAQENGVLLYDYAPVAISEQNTWADFMHHNPQGNLEQAQDIAKFLLDQNVIPKASPAAATQPAD